MQKNNFRLLKILLISLVTINFTGCLTTAAILKNKTIITHKANPMAVTGINWGFPTKGSEQYALFEEMGIQWIRTDFSWDKLEPEQGAWDFSHTDYFCEEATGKGFKIVGILGFDTPWIHKEPGEKREIPLDHLDSFLNYVTTVVERYGSYVDEWEIWNEPNLPFNTFWTGKDKDFFVLSKAVAARIKEIDPTAVVLGGSIWRYDKSFIKEMYEFGALDNIDIFSYHPYYDKPQKIYKKSRELQDDLALTGFRGDFRITEVGFNTYGRLPTSCKPEEQGRLVLETLVLLGELKHPYTIWYRLYNSSTRGSGLWDDSYGLMIKEGNSFEYKTGAWAFRRYNELIAGKYLSKEKISMDEKLEKKVTLALYEDGKKRNSLTMVILGEKKKQNLFLSGFESAVLYNAATGEVQTADNEVNITLLYDDPFIITLEGVTELSLEKE